ncbi:MAG TPA: carboxypeptidase-like regulatory domain-containing protein [Candidatus Binatia bacterium]|nr:carboxypeptidase-like regulatory domain-containing protein [Candidatus Binatia bacterium]
MCKKAMETCRNLFAGCAIFIAALAGFALLMEVGQVSAQEVAIDGDDIGGVVSGPNGPEAGVWVIAESNDFDTRYIKAVVTDDQGRYVLPDLPPANYQIWVRGYGLVDSPKTRSGPGSIVNLTAVPAPNDATAAQYYPAIYWYSMLEIPAKDQFGGKSKIPAEISQDEWLHNMKNNGCIGCHQLGNLRTRTIPHGFGSGEEGWTRRVQAGQAGGTMIKTLASKLGGAPFKYFADWTDRIAEGDLPHTKPSRPQGVERNIVVTVRDWLTPKHYLHDLISTDKRNPTVNAYGPVYGSAEFSTDEIPVLDPVKNEDWSFTAPAMEGTKIATAGHALGKPVTPSAYWGTETIWKSKTSNHNPMFDEEGRVWFAARVRNEDNPDFCQKGSKHPSAKLTPLDRSTRQLSVYNPKTKKYTFVNTCFSTHHLQFDEKGILWTSGGRTVVGWLDSEKFLETGDVAAAQGWSAMVLDTNGNGKRDEGYVGMKDKVDPTKDKRVRTGLYAVMPSPVDDSVWGTFRSFPGAVVRIVPGSNPPATTLTEVFNVPKPGFGPRGGDIDKNGVVWVSLASGHMGAFDRSKCKGPLNGPKATGDHCPEGWSFYKYPGPGFQGIGDNSAESSYYTWVDQHNTFGLGEDVPMSTGNLNDGLIALKDGKMITLRVPYPLGFYAKGFDGRIDDPNAGWKGRGLWTTSGDRTPWLMEGGKGSKPLVVHFQLRPDPLAK